MTNHDLIRGALQLLGVLDSVEQATAEDAALGLQVMNEFLEDWAADGIDVGHWPQTDLDAEFPGPSDTEHVVKAHLALHLAPYFRADVSPIVLASAQRGYERLLNVAVTAQMAPADMSHLPASAWRWDIESGG